MRTVAEFMAKSLVTAAPGETVTAVARRLTEHGIGGLPVLEAGGTVGILTLKDLVGQPPYRPVRQGMTRGAVILAPTPRLTPAEATMGRPPVGPPPLVVRRTVVR